MKELTDLIENSQLKPIQKMRAQGLVELGTKSLSKIEADTKIIANFTGEIVEEVILSTNDVKIYKIVSKPDDEWTTKYPYRFVFMGKINWRRGSTVCVTFDECLLSYLAAKHDGENSQFANFAMKMLSL